MIFQTDDSDLSCVSLRSIEVIYVFNSLSSPFQLGIDWNNNLLINSLKIFSIMDVKISIDTKNKQHKSRHTNLNSIFLLFNDRSKQNVY